MDEVYAWVDEQREDNRARYFRFLAEQRAIWTPQSVFSRCCVKWLADGRESFDEYGLDDEYGFRNGCDGRCGRDHPIITLRFDKQQNCTTATLSHDFDIFRQRILDDDRGWPVSATCYTMQGFLRENRTHLASGRFGAHLVVVAKGALEASDEAQELQRQRLERDASAAKVTKLTTAATLGSVLRALTNRGPAEVARVRLGDLIDLFGLFEMRRTSKDFRQAAETIASERLQSAKFTITPLVDGMEKHGEDLLDGFDSETDEIAGDLECLQRWAYKKCDNIELAPCRSGGGSGAMSAMGSTRLPRGKYCAAAGVEPFTWSSNRLKNGHRDEAVRFEAWDKFDEDYCGQKLVVRWHPGPQDGVQAGPRVGIYNQIKPTLGVQVVSFELGSDPHLGRHHKESGLGGISVTYEVTGCVLTKFARERDHDDESEDEEAGEVQHSGGARVVDLSVDFGCLVRLHAIQLQRSVKREHQRLQKTRPLTVFEKSYAKEIQSAIDWRRRPWADGAPMASDDDAAAAPLSHELDAAVATQNEHRASAESASPVPLPVSTTFHNCTALLSSSLLLSAILPLCFSLPFFLPFPIFCSGGR